MEPELVERLLDADAVERHTLKRGRAAYAELILEHEHQRRRQPIDSDATPHAARRENVPSHSRARLRPWPRHVPAHVELGAKPAGQARERARQLSARSAIKLGCLDNASRRVRELSFSDRSGAPWQKQASEATLTRRLAGTTS